MPAPISRHRLMENTRHCRCSRCAAPCVNQVLHAFYWSRVFRCQHQRNAPLCQTLLVRFQFYGAVRVHRGICRGTTLSGFLSRYFISVATVTRQCGHRRFQVLIAAPGHHGRKKAARRRLCLPGTGRVSGRSCGSGGRRRHAAPASRPVRPCHPGCRGCPTGCCRPRRSGGCRRSCGSARRRGVPLPT